MAGDGGAVIAVSPGHLDLPWSDAGPGAFVVRELEWVTAFVMAAFRALAAFVRDCRKERFPLSEVVVAEIGLAATTSLFLLLPETRFQVRGPLVAVVGFAAAPFGVLATWTLISLARQSEDRVDRVERVRPIRRPRPCRVRIVPGRCASTPAVARVKAPRPRSCVVDPSTRSRVRVRRVRRRRHGRRGRTWLWVGPRRRPDPG